MTILPLITFGSTFRSYVVKVAYLEEVDVVAVDRTIEGDGDHLRDLGVLDIPRDPSICIYIHTHI